MDLDGFDAGMAVDLDTVTFGPSIYGLNIGAEREPPARVGHNQSPLDVLLARVQDGDTQAFSELFECSRPLMYRVALSVTRSPAIAEEIVQDAMLKVWQRAATYHPDRGSASTWLAGVTRNRALDYLRRLKPTDIHCEDPESELLALRSDCSDPLAETDMSLAMLPVIQELSRMPEKMRRSLVLFFCQGCTHTEVAEILGAPLGSVKAWIRRGLSQLRAARDPSQAPLFAN